MNKEFGNVYNPKKNMYEGFYLKLQKKVDRQ